MPATISYEPKEGTEASDLISASGVRAKPGLVESRGEGSIPADAQIHNREFSVIDEQLGCLVGFLADPKSRGASLRQSAYGKLAVSAHEGAWAQGIPVELVAPLYKPHSISLSLTTGAEIKLTPSMTSEVSLIENGAVVAPAYAEIRCAHAESCSQVVVCRQEPNDSGVLSVRHGRPARISLYSETGRMLFNQVVAPGAHVFYRVSSNESYEGASATLLFSDGAPAADIEVDVLSNSAVAQSAGKQISDKNGQVAIPDKRSLSFYLKTNTALFSDDARLPAGSSVDATRRKLNVPADSMWWTTDAKAIQLQRSVNRVRLVDSDTGEPLGGACHMWKQLQIRNGGIAEILLFSPLLKDGWLEIPYGFSGGRKRVPEEGYSLVVRGYQETFLTEDIDPFSRMKDEVIIKMKPQTASGWLEVVDNGKPVDVGLLDVRTADGGERLFFGGISPSMRYGPFAAPGGEVKVLQYKSLELGYAHASGREDESFVLDVTGLLGGIRVEQTGSALPQLLALGTDGLIITPNIESGRVCVFSGLNAGRYQVGPVEIVEQLLSGATGDSAALTVEVKGGSIAVIKPSANWLIAEPLRGRVVVRDGAPVPVLVPIYSLPVQALRPSNKVIYVGTNGDYVIPAGNPTPMALAAVEFRGRVPRVRGVFWPGGDLPLYERRVHLSAENASPSGFVVRYRHAPNWTSVPVAPMTTVCELTVGVSAETLEFYVDKGVATLSLISLEDGETRSIDLNGAGDLELDVGALFAVESE